MKNIVFICLIFCFSISCDNQSQTGIKKIRELFKSDMIFSPSAIAVHPISQNIYISSSVGKLLMILNPSNEIVAIEKLKRKIHLQPEGLCFEKDGTLWMSNEAKEGKPAKLYKFKLK